MHSERRRMQLNMKSERREPDSRRSRVDRRLGSRARMSFWFLSWLRARDT
jgi:hypothetical protein